MYWLISKYNFQLTGNISVFVCPYCNAIWEFTAVSVINFWRTECVMREKFYFVSSLKFYRSEVQLMSILKFDWISNVCCLSRHNQMNRMRLKKHLKLVTIGCTAVPNIHSVFSLESNSEQKTYLVFGYLIFYQIFWCGSSGWTEY